MEHDKQSLELRLLSLAALSVNPLYREFVETMKERRDSGLANLLVIPNSVQAVIARERMMGAIEELETLTSWLDNEKVEAEQLLEQLKLEDKTKQNNED